MKSIPVSDIHPASFRDPSGFLYKKGGKLFRQVNRGYEDQYRRLMESGLYQDLVVEELLIPHQEASASAAFSDPHFKILEPRAIEFISYPYEWSFGQLKDAALTTLRIQKKALDHRMVLKDSSAYNIQFEEGRPLLIDTLSFDLYKEGEPWVAYRQFCQHFLAPLTLMARVDIRLGQLLKIYLDGIPLDLASELLGWKTRLSLPLLTHIHLHATAQRKYAGESTRDVQQKRTMSENAIRGLMDNLESAIRGQTWEAGGTAWADYEDTHNYTNAGRSHKGELVREFLKEASPASIWDLGANTGLFSRVASENGIPTYAFDIDPAAVEINYRLVVEKHETHLLPLLLDLTNPSPAIGWENLERASLLGRAQPDLTMALALVHHLAIGNNVPFARIRDLFAGMGPWTIIEFIPKQDSQVQTMLASREDIFDKYTKTEFETVFSESFNIKRAEAIRESERTLYLMERR